MSDERPSRDLDKFIVRLPDGMRDRLASRAKRNGRSSNAEAVVALNMWLDQADWIDKAERGDEAGAWPGFRPDTFPSYWRGNNTVAVGVGTSSDNTPANVTVGFNPSNNPGDVSTGSSASGSGHNTRLGSAFDKAWPENSIFEKEQLEKLVSRIVDASVKDLLDDAYRLRRLGYYRQED